MNTDKLQQRQQTLINLITRVGGRQNIQKWMDELLQIDIEQETKAMSKAVTYKKYQLKSNGVYFDGKLLPQDNWCLSKEYGVVLLNEKDADFDPNFELGYDLSGIALTVAEEKQMTQVNKVEFEKAWYLAYAARETGVPAPNWNRLENKHIEEIAATIPAKYWERAKTMTSNEAFQVYNASK